jgi:hypothetical protein
MSASTDIGATLAFASGAPATFDSAGYGAMSFTTVSHLVSLPEIGTSDATIAAPDLTSGYTQTLKGASTGKAGTVMVRDEGDSDAGQAAVQTASATTAENSFKLTYANGSIIYITGPVMNWKRNAATDTSYAGFSFDIFNNHREVYA